MKTFSSKTKPSGKCDCSACLFLLGIAASLQCSGALPPIAPHQLVMVDSSGEFVIAMRGYDLDGDSLVASLKTLPGSPSLLYQLSKVFSDYGYEPKMGTSISASVNVTGSQNRVLYKRPSIDSLPLGAWGIFTYTVSAADSTSLPGMITLVPPSGLIVASHFAQSAEGWKIVGNKAASSSALFESSSRGILNHFIYGSDDTINTDMAHGGDRSLWWFQAPEKFLGHQGISYGGSLDFVLSSFHGDFDAQNMNPGIFKSSGPPPGRDALREVQPQQRCHYRLPGGEGELFYWNCGGFLYRFARDGGLVAGPKKYAGFMGDPLEVRVY
eukprot:CAMPEP_0185751194 /NCGR_PEP_ID=MMETSP1174-20130828/9954_1 /TAXON_ID=35687 /ORGANISM="Dictyocha speculum, Strain CCMP1381" /LENGTH=325 /DNA_ID=CAMNT_0028428057 /DNA_START=48 /DNA_END=1024 /DNA_ORIENTATION=-